MENITQKSITHILIAHKKMELTREAKWRKEIKELSSEELDDELQRPIGDWKEDVLRESIRRILNSQLSGKKNKEVKNK